MSLLLDPPDSVRAPRQDEHVCNSVDCRIYHERIKQVIELVHEGMMVLDARIKCKISRQTFYKHLTHELREALTEAKLHGPTEDAEREVYKRGVEGVDEPLHYKGIPTGHTIKRYSDNCLFFYLNGNDPKYKGNSQVTINNANIGSTEAIKVVLTENETDEKLINFLSSASIGAGVGANGGNGNGHSLPPTCDEVFSK